MSKVKFQIEVAPPPQSRVMPYMEASAGYEGTFTANLYHCPTCPGEELRLTWDDLRKRHAGFCRECRKLWPLPRRTLSAKELRELADQRQIDLSLIR